MPILTPIGVGTQLLFFVGPLVIGQGVRASEVGACVPLARPIAARPLKWRANVYQNRRTTKRAEREKRGKDQVVNVVLLLVRPAHWRRWLQ